MSCTLATMMLDGLTAIIGSFNGLHPNSNFQAFKLTHQPTTTRIALPTQQPESQVPQPTMTVCQLVPAT